MGEWPVVQAALTEEQLDSMRGLVAKEPQIVFFSSLKLCPVMNNSCVKVLKRVSAVSLADQHRFSFQPGCLKR